MPPATGYSFGDVILVPFPFTDQTGIKKRPAVVVSSAVYHSIRVSRGAPVKSDGHVSRPLVGPPGLAKGGWFTITATSDFARNPEASGVEVVAATPSAWVTPR